MLAKPLKLLVRESCVHTLYFNLT